jgi:hypothetical protein
MGAVQACGIAGDPGSVQVSELLPHYAKLVSHLDAQYTSKQMPNVTVTNYLQVLWKFLSHHQPALRKLCSSVEYCGNAEQHQKRN